MAEKRAATDGGPHQKKAKSELPDDLMATIKQWVAWDPVAESRAEVEALVANGDNDELKARFGSRIAFGTAGLRAAMKAGPAFMNTLVVTQTAQGLCRYLEAQLGKEETAKRGIAIGFDGRYHSKEYAEATAKVFTSQGIKVYLMSKELVATPFVPFCVSRRGCAAGVMVTASHNPKNDNGYKVYWGNGCQIIPPHDAGIAASILENLEPWEVTAKPELVEDPLDDISKEYFAAVASLCYWRDDNAASTIPLTYTAMHGVGYQWVEQAFKAFGLPLANLVPTPEQVQPDPDFPTVAFPNPEEGKGALALAMKAAEGAKSSFILANDPDADRLAMAEQQQDGSWYVFNGNELGIVLADWAWQNYKKKNPSVDASKCVVMNTAVSSRMLAAMATAEGLCYEETLTGFKWLGNKAIDRINDGMTFIFGYEEAIGFMIGDTCFDKDGVRAAAVFGEMLVQLTKGLDAEASKGVVMKKLMSLKERYGFFSIDTKYFFCYDPTVMAAIFDRLRNYDEKTGKSYPKTCGAHEVTGVRDQTTGYDSSRGDQQSVLPMTPESHMVTFTFKNGCVATLRGSGTEPKLKYYVETKSTDEASAAALRQEMQDVIVKEFLQPEKNGLVPPKKS